MKLGIDLKTADKEKAMEQLSSLPEVDDVVGSSVYREDPTYCQITIETAMSEQDLDDWLCDHADFDWVGTFTAE